MRRTVLLTFLVLAVGCTGPPKTDAPSPSPTVPAVVGQQFAVAQASLSPSAVVTPSGAPQLSATDPQNTILKQDPPAGTTYAPGTTVTIHVVLSARPVRVPSVVGLSLTKAKSLLAGRHLRFSVLKVASSKAQWAVLKQGVRAGKGVAPGSRVGLTVVSPHLCGYPLNRWCFSVLGGGSYIYDPPSNLCDYTFGVNCISSFWSSTNGYVIQCADGEFSHSGGVSGSCSSHGGNWRPLYS